MYRVLPSFCVPGGCLGPKVPNQKLVTRACVRGADAHQPMRTSWLNERARYRDNFVDNLDSLCSRLIPAQMYTICAGNQSLKMTSPTMVNPAEMDTWWVLSGPIIPPTIPHEKRKDTANIHFDNVTSVEHKSMNGAWCAGCCIPRDVH